MKKLLTILGAVGLTATTGATVVACGQDPDEQGNFSIKAKDDKKSLEVGETLEIDIEKFADEVKGKFEKFAVAFGNDDQKKFVDVDDSGISEGKFTITANGEGVGKFDLHLTAFTVKKEDDKKEQLLTQEEEAPKADAKSQVLHLEVKAIDLAKAFTDDEKNLGEVADEAAAKAEVEKLIAANANLEGKVKVEPVEGKKEIKVSPDKDVTTLTGTCVFTYTTADAK